MMRELTLDMGSGHHVVRTVFVECGSGYKEDGPRAFRPVGETAFVVRANPGGTIGSIVGYADLRVPGITDVLAAHIEAALADSGASGNLVPGMPVERSGQVTRIRRQAYWATRASDRA